MVAAACFGAHAKVIIMMMNGTGWIKTEVDLAYLVVLLYSSSPALKFLRGSSARLRDKLCFPKTKQLVDIRQPPSAEARSADHNFVDSYFFFVDSVPAVEMTELMFYCNCNIPGCTY